MKSLIHEFRHFLSYPRDMRILLLTNLVYGFVLPVIEIFVGAYVMRNSNDVKMVVAYQLAVYTGIPITFYLNGLLMRHVKIASLYSLGMLLSGISMTLMMSLGTLSLGGIAAAGLVMGMSFGLYWANRDFLALSSTDDSNRNYYYGIENFFATNIAIVVPLSIGAFIAAWSRNDWFGGVINQAYQAVTAVVFLLAVLASILVHQGGFQSPPPTRFVFFRYHRLWRKLQYVAILRGLTSGYIVTAPAMLIMRLVGKEGSIGVIQSAGAVLSAIILYIIGRTTGPKHRIYLYTLGLALFVIGTVPNAMMFNGTGVLIFMVCLLLARPLQDIAYFTMQMLVIDTVSAIEKRNQYAYIFNQEFGYYIGRASGCVMFILLAFYISDTFALRYALLIVAMLQFFSAFIARDILTECAATIQSGADGRAAELVAADITGFALEVPAPASPPAET